MKLSFLICPDRTWRSEIRSSLQQADVGSRLVPPEPSMSGPWLQMVGFKTLETSRKIREVKAHSLERAMSGETSEAVWVDLNPMFMYTYFDTLDRLNEHVELTVVNLIGDLSRYGNDLRERRVFSPWSREGRFGTFWPTWPQSFSRICPTRTQDDVELIRHHINDIGIRRNHVKDLLGSKVTWVDVVAETSTPGEVSRTLVGGT